MHSAIRSFLAPRLSRCNCKNRQAGKQPTLRRLTRAAAAKEALLLSDTRQLTFEGRRAGEGYFSQDGSQLVFQSEREPGNPFFQIYLMDRETGDVQRVSPGRGKTTCAWIHPDGDKVLFASTHDDESAVDKQRAEIELRKSGKERRYSWDYDEHFEIYEFDRKTHEYRKLTNARGYDAEGSWSPDGKLIAFTSNRRAYEGELTADGEKAIRARSGDHERHLYHGRRRRQRAATHVGRRATTAAPSFPQTASGSVGGNSRRTGRLPKFGR